MPTLAWTNTVSAKAVKTTRSWSRTFVGPTCLSASLEHLEVLLDPVDASLLAARDQGWYTLLLEKSFSNFRPEA